MAYRSIKRAFGDTSLERKCRVLFVFCLASLVSLAFWWVGHIAENLVRDTAVRKGRDLVELALLRHHWTEVMGFNRDEEDWENLQEFLREIARDLGTQSYDWKVLALEDVQWAEVPADPRERAIVQDLGAEIREQLRTDSFQVDAEQPLDVGDGLAPLEDSPSATTQPEESGVVPPPDNRKESIDIKTVFRFETLAEAVMTTRNGGRGPPTQNEQKVIVLPDGATGGTFTLTYDGQESVPISFNASDADIKAALEDPSTVGLDDVVVTGANGGPWTVEFQGTNAGTDVAAMKIDGGDLAARQEIHYYQPVYWKNSCIRCHGQFEVLDASGRPDAMLFSDPATYPIRVVKVTIPGGVIQDAITWNRSILAAIGILTVFMAMVVLYVIIRYVVVKPLKHLRDVSEEISRGNTELRAESNTNDEFEELADAFNRMLRHLTDTEAELRQVNTSLDAKLDQLAQLNMRLYEMNRLKSDFLTNMSHELRTPLNSIIGFSEVLQGIDSLSDKQKRYAQNIRESGRVLLDMINDILDLAKIEAGKMDVHPSEFRIGHVITAQCDLVRTLSEEKNIDLGVDVRPDLPVVFQDQSKIQQIVLNLLSNAIKFTPEGGRITVSADRDSHDQLVIAVADTGVGIAEEDGEIIFEKFRQSSNLAGETNLTREYSGTGLGLSIVKELCILLGGEITFESVLGKGSTFRAILPWTLPHAGHRGTGLDAQLEELARSQTLDSHRTKEVAPQPELPAVTTG